MDVLKLSTDWARAEILSAKLVLLFSVLVFLLAIGFWQLGVTGMARAFIIPLMVMALLSLTVGIGLYMANKPRISQFASEYGKNPDAFIQNELARTAKSQRDFNLVFKALPAIIIAAALVIIFIPGTNSRSIAVTVILLMSFLMLVDSQTEARNEAYHQKLLKIKH